MKPIDQTRDGETGNCYCAALASILEVSLEAMPDITAEEMYGRNWSWFIRSYLWKHHRLMPIELDGRLIPYVKPIGYHLISGKSPRNPNHGHATVGFGGEIVHDPHPSRAGLASVQEFTFLVPVNIDAIKDERHKTALLKWLEHSPCICPACGVPA